MTRNRLIAALVLASCAFAWTPAANALTWREHHALDIAKSKWGHLPCGGKILMERRPLLDDESGGDPNVGAVTLAPCTIVYDPAFLGRMPWTLYCTLTVHEIGHLLGVGHSPDPRSVMYRTPSNYWRCDRHLQLNPRTQNSRPKAAALVIVH